jgi:two-component system chemotaxis response regulator CheB
MINTLIVDDSAMARAILRDFLESDGNFNIIDEAADGEEGIQKILSLNPDLVTLDIEMPKKNGLEVIKEVMKKTSVPIVVVTNHDTAKTAYEATLLGALEFYPKDAFTTSGPEKQKAIYETLKRISGVKAQMGTAGLSGIRSAEPALSKQTEPAAGDGPLQVISRGPAPVKREIQAVVIASSTGGPKALSRFFTLMPGTFPVPIVIVQHNSTGFDKSFVQWLDTFTNLNVKLAEEGGIPVRDTVYVAQTDKHLMLRSDGQSMILHYNDDPPENNQKPAADVLFRTAAEGLGASVISVVLTGMGSDGASGTQKIKEMGGITLAQDEESCLIYGMPKAAAETGCVDIVLPLDQIPGELVKLTS